MGKLDIKTLKRVRDMFMMHSDHSAFCNGFRSLEELIESQEKLASDGDLANVMSSDFLWDDTQVICFVNFFLKVHKLDDRFQLENKSIIESYKNGDMPEQWH